MPITDPHFPPPESVEDCVALLEIGGTECIKPSMLWLEANLPQWQWIFRDIHDWLNKAGYSLEEILGVPDGTFGAGGSGKGGGG